MRNKYTNIEPIIINDRIYYNSENATSTIYSVSLTGEDKKVWFSYE